MDLPDIRQQIAVRLRQGLLPPAPAEKLYGGTGSDTPCCCCGQVISRQQLEFEVQFGIQGKGAMHPQCLRLWYEECLG